jgi:hypothetical protein
MNYQMFSILNPVYNIKGKENGLPYIKGKAIFYIMTCS